MGKIQVTSFFFDERMNKAFDPTGQKSLTKAYAIKNAVDLDNIALQKFYYIKVEILICKFPLGRVDVFFEVILHFMF